MVSKLISLTAAGSVRLVAGSSTTSAIRSSGRLEIYLHSAWGTVCVDFFNQPDADVACRQLGYARSDNHGTVASLGCVVKYNNIHAFLDFNRNGQLN